MEIKEHANGKECTEDAILKLQTYLPEVWNKLTDLELSNAKKYGNDIKEILENQIPKMCLMSMINTDANTLANVLPSIAARLSRMGKKPDITYAKTYIPHIERLLEALPAHKEIINGYEIAPNANLDGADLKGASLEGVNLDGASLKGANLEGAELVAAQLNDANLENANLVGATLDFANMVGANLKGANLKGASLENAILQKANLKGANLENAILSFAVLNNCDLEGANLEGATLSKAYLTKASAKDANLTKANLTESNLAYSNFTNANLTHSNLSFADLTHATFNKAIFNYAQMKRTRIYQTKINYCDFKETIMDDVLVSEVAAKHCNFVRCNAKEFTFTSVDLEGSSFSSSRFVECGFLSSNLKDTEILDTTFSECNFDFTELNSANVSGSTFKNTEFFNVDLTDIKNLEISVNALSGASFNNCTIDADLMEQLIAAQREANFEVINVEDEEEFAQLEAFEIHNAFNDLNIGNFMKIINEKNRSSNQPINTEKPMKPLVDYMTQNNIAQTKIAQINELITDLTPFSEFNNNRQNVAAVIQYVLSQPRDFVDMYINNFIQDCLNAYTRGPQLTSCLKGKYERIFTVFRDIIATFCMDEIAGDSSAKNAACKPEYIEIFNCFYNIPSINELFQEWYTASSNSPKFDEEVNTKEKRMAHFRDFIKTKIGENKYNMILKKTDKYIDENASIFETMMLGGRKKQNKRRKTNKRQKKGKKMTLKQKLADAKKYIASFRK